MAKVNGNMFLWVLTYIANIIVGLLGLGLIIISVILFVQAEKIFTLGFLITSVGIVAIITACGIILASRYSSTMICLMYFLQGLLTLLFIGVAIYMAIDFDGLINVISEKTQTSEEERQRIEKFIKTNLKICHIASYVIVAVLVS